MIQRVDDRGGRGESRSWRRRLTATADSWRSGQTSLAPGGSLVPGTEWVGLRLELVTELGTDAQTNLVGPKPSGITSAGSSTGGSGLTTTSSGTT